MAEKKRRKPYIVTENDEPTLDERIDQGFLDKQMRKYGEQLKARNARAGSAKDALPGLVRRVRKG